MPDYSIKLDLPNVSDVDRIFNSKVFPLLTQAVQAIAVEVRSNWIDSVMAAPLWQGEKIKYAQSIKIDFWGDGLRADVIADYPNAGPIETGRPARDLKPMLLNSPKVRRTKDGRRFLVVPFRHNTPGNTAHAPAMPTSVYELASAMKPSTVTGQGTRPAGQDTILSPGSGMTPSPNQTPFLSNPATKSTYLVANQTYSWGGRLKASDLGEAGLTPQQKKRYGGMVRMSNSDGGNSYLTFRVVMEGSAGWVVPARPGLFIARDVAEHIQPIAEEAISEALRRESLVKD